MSELKPCQCGGNAELVDTDEGYFISCSECEIRTSEFIYKDYPYFVERWNHRPVEDELKSRLEEAEKLLKNCVDYGILPKEGELEIKSFLKGGENERKTSR